MLWGRKRTASQSLALRARIVLACADDGGIAPLTAVRDVVGLYMNPPEHRPGRP